MWYRIDIGCTEKRPVEHHVGRHCFVESDTLEQANIKAIKYFQLHPLKDLKINNIDQVSFTPDLGVISYKEE